MMFKLRRSSSLLFLFFVVFSATVLFLSVRQLCGEDSGISGGAQGSTSIVTGTDEECKEPSSSTEECIVHKHEYDTTSTNTACSAAGRIAPSGGEKYCVMQSISYSLSKTGENTAGKKTTTYSACKICGASYPGTNPETSDHDVTFPSNPKWDALDCGANPASGSGETASFVGNDPSSAVNSSSVVFKFDDGRCNTYCGTLPIGPYTTNFTVIEVLMLFAETDTDIAVSWEGYTETLLVPYEKNLTVAISALSDPSGADGGNVWPEGKPAWTPDGEGDSFDFPVPAPGEYTVTAECGNEVSVIIRAIKVKFDPDSEIRSLWAEGTVKELKDNLKYNDNQAVEAHTRRCTHPVENPDTEQQDEERVYRADELVFAVRPYGLFPQTDVKIIVDIAPAEMWEQGTDGSYGIGGYNVDNNALGSAGVNIAELMEGQFEVLEGDTEHDVIANMIEAGFRYSQSFIDYIKEQASEEYGDEE